MAFPGALRVLRLRGGVTQPWPLTPHSRSSRRRLKGPKLIPEPSTPQPQPRRSALGELGFTRTPHLWLAGEWKPAPRQPRSASPRSSGGWHPPVPTSRCPRGWDGHHCPLPSAPRPSRPQPLGFHLHLCSSVAPPPTPVGVGMEAEPPNLQTSLRKCKYLLGSPFPQHPSALLGCFCMFPSLFFIHLWLVGTYLAEQVKYLPIWEVVKSWTPKPAHALWLALQQEGLGQESEF